MNIEKSMFVKIVDNIGMTNPEFASCLRKWIPLLISVVGKINYVTGKSPEDALQEILIGISEINSIYNIPLYRYRGRLYEKVKEDGILSYLQTPRNNKSKPYNMWVETKKLVKVKKGKLESTIYTEIRQQGVDIINAHFTQKNGYTKSKIVKLVTIRSDADGLKSVPKVVDEIQKNIDETHYDGANEEKEHNLHTPEDQLIYRDYVNSISNKVSNMANKVLETMICYPGISIGDISSYLDISKSDAMLCKCEIIRNFPFDLSGLKIDNKSNIKPIYMKANRS